MILWALPAGMTALAIVALVLGAARVTHELAALQAELGRLRSLRIPLEELRDGTAEARAAVVRMGSR